ncbi:MAG: HAD-IA family hydrolase [Bryobacteraceae bacterium]|nr:HAD-IA family hydrolase [Bryobacteraceae bacterium]
MALFDLVIFDLDGTLIDSKADLVNAVNATRSFLDRDPLDAALIASYVGNGAPVLIRRVMGEAASDEEVSTALDYFIRYYHEHCLDETRLYPGSEETIALLREQRVKMAILTNKPVRISKRIVAGLGLEHDFFEVYGGNSFDQKKPHPIGIHRLMEQSGISPVATLMVGDSSVDIETARNAHVASCGCRFGFAPESLTSAQPDFLIDHMAELGPLVITAA